MATNMGNVCSSGCRWRYFTFPQDVFVLICDLIVSVPENFPTYFCDGTSSTKIRFDRHTRSLCMYKGISESQLTSVNRQFNLIQLDTGVSRQITV